MTPTNDQHSRLDHPPSATTEALNTRIMSASDSAGSPEIQTEAVISNLETDSDYGEFADDAEELQILENLLSRAENWRSPEDTLLRVTDIEDYEPPKGVRLPKILGFEHSSHLREPISTTTRGQVLLDFQAQNTGIRRLGDGTKVSDRLQGSISPDPEARPAEPDTRSPLERFRRPPKKVLSVTDLISPSWCELQYFYTLSKHGRKKRTPAMKQGSKVHQDLEDEVHVTVPVEIQKKEDSWGLRIWNIIQGLRTLRDTGRTREIEIWGTVGGEIVNGVIDELSYDCPDHKLEEASCNDQTVMNGGELPEYQTSITDYLLAAGTRKEDGQSISEAMASSRKSLVANAKRMEKRIYITDVKTRAHPTLPTGASIRPTILQLHLYHHMLENLAQGNFALVQLAERYDLDTNEPFSDSFIAQIGGLNQDFIDTASSSSLSQAVDPITASQVASSQDSMDILLQNNNLNSLWAFMMSQFRQTFLLLPPVESEKASTSTPESTSDLDPPSTRLPSPTRLSPLLTAEYLSPTYKHVAGTTKKSIGSKSFIFNPSFLRSYLEDNLAWWKGEREPRGVELQEAWKCRSCDFRDDCVWIHDRDTAAVAEANERRKMREMVGVGPSDGLSKSKV